MKLKPHYRSLQERELTRILGEEIMKEVDKEIIKDLIETTKKRNYMTNVFTDQKTFMIAGDQSVDTYSESQYNMYLDLIKEEVGELHAAVDDNDRVEQLDALIDILVVTVGALHSLGVDAEGAWNEVIRSNMSKVDPTTGKVIKREDGKILKPESYSPPSLQQFVNN
jgi:predicted HAD superfamily Cof-like phosphohydrolase